MAASLAPDGLAAVMNLEFAAQRTYPYFGCFLGMRAEKRPERISPRPPEGVVRLGSA